MPLPGNNTTWPPKHLEPILHKLHEWAAWQAGDVDKLTELYTVGQIAAQGNAVRPAQYAGGVYGKVARWFWGQPIPDGQQQSKVHVPLAARLASTSANLLYGEALTVTPDDTAAGDRLEYLLEQNAWDALLVELGETTAGLGGGYLRTTWDSNVADHAILTLVHADAAIPEFSYGRLAAVTFWWILADDNGDVWRHLERHDKGRIEHGLYQGTRTSLGTRVPLTERPETAGIDVDASSAVATGYADGLTAAYVPNRRKPTGRWRHHPIGHWLGRSDYDGIEPMLDKVDEIHTSWMRDIRLGKARIMIPSNLLQSLGPGQGATFDLDREIFTQLAPIAGSAKDQQLPIVDQQFDIRVDPHLRSAQYHAGMAVLGAGYSLQTFGLDDAGNMTATEVDARERETNLTRELKTRYATPGLRDALQALTAVDAAKFPGKGKPTTVQVEFPGMAAPSTGDLAAIAVQLRTAQAASTKTLVKLLHPDWDADTIDQEVSAIGTETGIAVPDPTTFRPGIDEQQPPGTDGQQQPTDPAGEPVA